MQQIQELQEQFNNLFEVDGDGLGQPAVDVPPSQNKIKRDRKTKDGKVELVSVEDELFPYDGNKREQYRQKIIATINDMIQGKATLEDLLQIVRQKKAPLKEAMEVLECIINEYTEEDKKEAAKKVLPQRKAEFDKAFDDYEKVHSKINPERILKYKLTPVEQYRANKTATKLERAEDRLNHAQEVAGNVEKTPHGLKIKEAMELLEDIHKMIDKHGDKIGPKSELHDLMRTYQREAAIQYAEEKGKPWGERWKDEQDFEDRRKGEDTKNYKGQRKTTEKQFKGFGTVTVGGAEPDELEKKIRREHAKKAGRPVKEAIEIMETVLDAIKKSDNPDEKKEELRKKLADAYREERKKADYKAYQAWVKGERNQNDVAVVRSPEFTKNANGERATRLRSGHYTENGGAKIKPEWKQVEDSIKRYAKKQAKKGPKITEALSLMEEIINELSPATINNALDKRTEQSIEADEKERKEFNDILKIEDRDKRANAYKEFKKKSDDRFNKEDKKLDLYFKYALKHPETLKEAMEVLEDLEATITKKYGPLFGDKTSRHGAYLHRQAIDNNVREVIDAAKRNLPDEEKNSTMAIDREANKIEAKRANTKNKKGERKTRLLKAAYGRDKEEYEKYLKRHPELVKENLEDQIEKKFKKGEISLDKAFELAKKVESKMSQDKNNQEREDKIQKEAWKIGPNVEKAAQQRQIGKSIRRNERKNALTFEALDEATKLMEEVINEVSVKMWKDAAKNSIDKRREAADNTAKAAEQSWDDYEEYSRKHPEEEDALYKRAWRNDIVAKKAEEKADHASDVLNVRAKGKSANKTIKAAKNSEVKRNDAYLQNDNPEKFNNLRRRMMKVDQLVTADPVKSRANEALEEAMKVLEDLQSKIQAQPKEKRADLEAKFAKMKQKEGKDMLQRILDRRKAMTKQERGQEKTEERNEEAYKKYIAACRDYMDNTPSMYEFESLEEAIAILELFDRPDLLDDIDTTLGSPVKKTFKKIITPKKTCKKENK